FTAELGARFDRHTLLGESFVSPRLNLAFAPGTNTVLRAGWGIFRQSHRPYELQVEDGQTGFAEAERGEHVYLGFEHVVGGEGRLAGLAFRAEAYRRETDNPRVRFENLFEPFNTFPELEPDRVEIRPQRGRGQGIELFLRGPRRGRLAWWVNYAYASSEDRIGSRWVPRKVDQPHTLNLDLEVALGKRWRLNAAWKLRSGWPTTQLTLVEIPPEPGGDPGDPGGGEEGGSSGEPEDGDEGDGSSGMEEPGGTDDPGDMEEGPEILAVLGPLNSRRLPTYHRLDLRLSRELKVRRGRLTLFFEAQNAYNRNNLSGFDVVFDDDLGQLVITDEFWPGIVPSLGLTWEL
ncbi:MAG: TonB-dependent receptor, partial [Acidobacteria bacterium]|nr:TonB-dependent receptor [Acidobacteriota bacterium]